jgi:hypothetical protein
LLRLHIRAKLDAASRRELEGDTKAGGEVRDTSRWVCRDIYSVMVDGVEFFGGVRDALS